MSCSIMAALLLHLDPGAAELRLDGEGSRGHEELALLDASDDAAGDPRRLPPPECRGV